MCRDVRVLRSSDNFDENDLLCNTGKVDSFATFPDSIEVGDTIKEMLSKMSIAGSYI